VIRPKAVARCLLVAVSLASIALAGGRLTLERIFSPPPLGGSPPEGLAWRPAHAELVWIESRGEGDAAHEVLVAEDAATGARRVLLDPAALELPEGAQRPSLDALLLSPDGQRAVLHAGERLLLAGLEGGGARVLESAGGRFATFSPDGSRLAFVREHDLYVLDLATGREVRLTRDGSDTVRNGELDWVYWEELANRSGKAFAWSPDGRALAWLRTDDAAIPEFAIVDLLATHSRLIRQRYPKAGDPAPEVSLHVAYLDGSGSPRATLALDPGVGGGYLPRFGWTPDGTALWCQLLDRAQDTLRLVRVALPSGDLRTVLTQRDPYWVEPVDLFRPLPDGRFLWGSRASGFMHLELRRADGTLERDLTPGPYEVTELVDVDPEGGRAWYVAARPSPLERRVYRVDLATGRTDEITPAPGTHAARPAPDHRFLLVTSSTIATPPRVDLVTSGGRRLRSLHEPDTAELDAGGLPEPRFLTVPADDGTPLHAMLIVPPGGSGERHPAVVYVYGGPHAQVVRNAWGRSILLFHRWLAAHGFVVFALDNRGSAARGREFEGAVDHRLGQTELADQLAGVRWLKAQPFVDPDRIGIWGWSYGGYMTCYALTHAPGVFRAGAAVAPVTDWRLYDSIYTERYMGTPAENPDGYAAGSVLQKVSDLRDALLVIHGTGDDNVHLQNTLQLADRAWRAGRTFDLMLLPNLKHGLRAEGSHLAVFRRIARHFFRHLADRDEVPE